MNVVSVNIGALTTILWKGKEVKTGLYKKPVKTPIFLAKETVEGDVVVDRRYHGGVDQAVYAYSKNHYNYWKELYPNLDWEYGMFGENLTVEGLDEAQIRVGDVYKLGTAIIEVTKPREPCMKLGVRFGTQKVLKQFWNNTKCGVYFKIIQPGKVAVGDQFKIIKTTKTALTIAALYDLKK